MQGTQCTVFFTMKDECDAAALVDLLDGCIEDVLPSYVLDSVCFVWLQCSSVELHFHDWLDLELPEMI